MEPKKIIFDTDIGGDSDDVAALDLLLSAQQQGLCRLVGISCSSLIAHGFSCARAVLAQHHMEHIPLCAIPTEHVEERWYGTAVSRKFPALARFDKKVPEPVPMLRRLIRDTPGVVIVVVGDLRNLADLLQSGPDGISPLSGTELVRENVSFVACMAGDFTHQNGILSMEPELLPDGSIKPRTEYNIQCSIPAAETFFRLCPVPVYVLPFEAGYNVICGHVLAAGGGETPDSFSFTAHGQYVNGNHSWDPMTALFAVWGAAPFLECSPPGKITVDRDGITDYTVCKGGKHFLLQRNADREEIGAFLDAEIAKIL